MTKRRYLPILGAAAAMLTAAAMVATPAVAADPVVRIGDGALRGSAGDGVHSYLGIPYAAAPVGELRWRAPRPPEPWQGVRDATRIGSPCPQLDTRHQPPTLVGSEDCLFLNVDVPANARKPVPVMVFIHGGLIGGQGGAYDPGRVVRQGEVAVVTINYRLGALGFLDHPGLRDPYSGNFGIADQQAALRWVRNNIGAFGGDPRNVTLWGESGGGFNTCAQLASPSARGLFDKAIVMSAPCGNELFTRAGARRTGLKTAADLGCGDARHAEECLRDKPFAELTGLYQGQHGPLHRRITGLPWLPVTGTPAVPFQPLTALRVGVNPVPLLHGGTREEANALVANNYDRKGHSLTAAQYPGVVRDLFGSDAEAVLARYPAAKYSSPGVALATILSDEGRAVGACGQLPANDAAARRAPVYAYEFAEPSPEVVGEIPIAASHGVDIPYFFSGRGSAKPLPPHMKPLSEQLIGHWTAFARTGDPGWARYRDGIAQSLAAGHSGPVDVARNHQCGFWRTR
ncbi:carboxylesterase/lipase family protein [Amycolatopsis suaedae]|uniref:Carboxylic ester hydrolase n=1 Tax=Amycolatopsis suaedae TaxID=2510978 RepID=A0A4Q7JD28_9PSEU|nr:carboxylesterase family protein [Amycolatopsis suaedae]RZQ64962.1 carboxylesterase [Amycolatopsis suaedae]